MPLWGTPETGPEGGCQEGRGFEYGRASEKNGRNLPQDPDRADSRAAHRGSGQKYDLTADPAKGAVGKAPELERGQFCVSGGPEGCGCGPGQGYFRLKGLRQRLPED